MTINKLTNRIAKKIVKLASYVTYLIVCCFLDSLNNENNEFLEKFKTILPVEYLNN